jgi:hypothetical protein
VSGARDSLSLAVVWGIGVELVGGEVGTAGPVGIGVELAGVSVADAVVEVVAVGEPAVLVDELVVLVDELVVLVDELVVLVVLGAVSVPLDACVDWLSAKVSKSRFCPSSTTANRVFPSALSASPYGTVSSPGVVAVNVAWGLPSG